MPHRECRCIYGSLIKLTPRIRLYKRGRNAFLVRARSTNQADAARRLDSQLFNIARGRFAGCASERTLEIPWAHRYTPCQCRNG